VAKLATALGLTKDAQKYPLHLSCTNLIRYTNLADQIRQDFNTFYFDNSTSTYKTSQGYQSANALPIFAGIVEDQNIELVAKTLTVQ
jgi:hypothetical protein